MMSYLLLFVCDPDDIVVWANKALPFQKAFSISLEKWRKLRLRFVIYHEIFLLVLSTSLSGIKMANKVDEKATGAFKRQTWKGARTRRRV